MIRLNLVSVRVVNVDVNPYKPLVAKVLGACLFLQAIVYWLHITDHQKRKEAIELLKKQISVMEVRKKEFLELTPPEKISGLVLERNTWLKGREKMPVFILAKLEKDVPPGVELKVFESGTGGGNLQLVAPDMDTATKYLTDVLGTKNVRVNMVDRVPEGILAACTWIE